MNFNNVAQWSMYSVTIACQMLVSLSPSYLKIRTWYKKKKKTVMVNAKDVLDQTQSHNNTNQK